MKPELQLMLEPSSLRSGKTTRRRLAPLEADASAKEIVWHRDDHVCGFCGFRALKYQEVVVWGGNARDVDSMTTACVFCHQCFYLKRAAAMRSTFLVWMPDITQVDINRAARELYIARLAQGEASAYAQAVFDLVVKRREPVRQHFGNDEIKKLCEQLEASDASASLLASGGELAGLRLFPLDRRILKTAEYEFNHFPQILAFWRSADGPYGMNKSMKWVERLEQAARSPVATT